jgi:hypothetical protein
MASLMENADRSTNLIKFQFQLLFRNLPAEDEEEEEAHSAKK